MTAVVLVHVSRLHPDPANRPHNSGEADLHGMARTMRVLGVLQPLIVSPFPGRPGHYLIRAGHRRWKAAQLAGLSEVPVVTSRMSVPLVGDGVASALMQVVENGQRASLGPVELAMALDTLRRQGATGTGRGAGMSQADIARFTGFSEATISYHLSLLKASKDTLDRLRRGELTAGAVHEAVKGMPDMEPGVPRTGPRPGARRAKPYQGPRNKPHFTAAHPLAADANRRCREARHPAPGRLHKVACEQCWEAAIVADTLNRGGQPLGRALGMAVPVPVFTGSQT